MTSIDARQEKVEEFRQVGVAEQVSAANPNIDKAAEHLTKPTSNNSH